MKYITVDFPMISSDWLFETTLKISSSRKREDSIETASKCVQLVKLHKNLDLLALFFPNLVAEADADGDRPADGWGWHQAWARGIFCSQALEHWTIDNLIVIGHHYMGNTMASVVGQLRIDIGHLKKKDCSIIDN